VKVSPYLSQNVAKIDDPHFKKGERIEGGQNVHK
jgi:hypothetical protein